MKKNISIFLFLFINFVVSPCIAATGNISGVVTRAVDGQPIAGLWVHADDPTTGSSVGSAVQTQANGSYTLTNLNAGSYKIMVYSSGTSYASQYYQNAIDSSSATPVAVTAGQTTSNIHFSLEFGGKIMGVVKRASDGAPISGLSITAYADSGSFGGYAQTEYDGSYTIKGLNTGSYRVDVNGGTTSYISQYYLNAKDSASATPVTVTIGQTIANVNFNLLVGGKITGVVKRASDGTPLQGIIVFACPISVYISSCGTVQTEADGSYVIKGLSSDSYRISVSGWGTDFIGTDYQHATPVAVTIGQTVANIDFNLVIGGKITGVVKRASDGAPLQGLTVQAYDSANNSPWASSVIDTQTETDGSYAIRGLNTGSYKIKVTAWGKDYLDAYFLNAKDYGSAAPLAVMIGQTIANVNFNLVKSGKITGVVKRASDGAPMEGIKVTAYDAATYGGYTPDTYAEDWTGADGRYTIERLNAGKYLVVMNASGADYVTMGYHTVDNPDSATPVVVSMGQTTANIDFNLVAGGKITGVVKRASDGAPISGLSVYAFSTSDEFSSAFLGGFIGASSTEADGSYAIKGLSAGSYQIEVRENLFDMDVGDYAATYYHNVENRDSATPVTVTMGQTTTDVDFNLVIGGKITGIVKRASDGTPLQGLTVQALPVSGGVVSNTQTEVDGTYTIKGLNTGSYQIEVKENLFDMDVGDYAATYYHNVENRDSATPVTVTMGQTTTNVDFNLVIGGKITGIVKRASDGVPIPGLRVTASAATGGASITDITETEADGSYTIKRLNSGSYKVSVDPSGTDYMAQYYKSTFKSYDYTPVSVTLGDTTQHIDFNLSNGGAVFGMVQRESDGHPIAGAYVVAVSINANGAVTRSAVSGLDGTYLIKGLPPGIYQVRLSSSNEGDTMSFNHQASVTAGQTTPNINFLVSSGGRITGLVTSATDGKPLANILVGVADYAIGSPVVDGIPTAFDGSYTIAGLPEGQYKVYAFEGLSAYSRGYTALFYKNTGQAPLATPVAVVANQTTSAIDFSLSMGGSIAGTVSDRNGRPIPNLLVQAYDTSTGSLMASSSTTDSYGFYLLTGLPIGAYLIFVDTKGADIVSTYYNNVLSKNLATPVPVTVGQFMSGIDFTLIKIQIGDIDRDGDIGLTDAILALQVSSMMQKNSQVYTTADVNGDGKIGLAEIIYILQTVAGIR